MRFFLINKTTFFITLLFFPLVFRNVLDTNLGVVGGLLSVTSIGIGMIVLFASIATKLKIGKNFIPALFFIFYIIFCVFLYPFVGIVNYWITPFWGAFQLLGPLILSISVLYFLRQRFDFEKIVLVLVMFAFINAIGGIIQFYVSSNLFGLISNRVLDGSFEHVTKRAISFLASPQSLSIYLAFCLTLVRYVQTKFFFKLIISLTIFYCGVLTGSKAFFVYIFAYFILLTPTKYKVFLISSLFVLVSLTINLRTGIDTFDRVLDLPLKLLKISEYETFIIWKQFIIYPSGLEQVLFGHGVGVVSNFSQTFNDYKLFNGSTESFLIQVYFESGMIGLILFMVMFLYPSIRIIKIQKYRAFSCSMIALLSNMAFTPAFYGLTAASLFYLAYSLSLRISSLNR